MLAIPRDTVWKMMERCSVVARNLLDILSARMRNEHQNLMRTHNRVQEFARAANIDPLTGLHNRRWLLESFPRAIKRCERDHAPVCLCMADVDHFKEINDSFGHLAGDQVLLAVGRRLVDGFRTQDLIARYGGDEFAILLPRTNLDEGYTIAERLRVRLAEVPLVVGGLASETITVSLGLAVREGNMALGDLLSAADRALYRAKTTGRNRVAVAGAQ